MRVITSYSIHYTKLYEYSDAASQEARIAAAELGEQLLAETIAQMA